MQCGSDDIKDSSGEEERLNSHYKGDNLLSHCEEFTIQTSQRNFIATFFGNEVANLYLSLLPTFFASVTDLFFSQQDGIIREETWGWTIFRNSRPTSTKIPISLQV